MLLLVLFSTIASGFLPGIKHKEYADNERIALYASTLNSEHTQLPFDYYSHNFCKESDFDDEDFDNIGQALSGDTIERTPYKLFMDKNSTCNLLCTKTLSEDNIKDFQWLIDNKYRAQWIVDKLPSGLRITQQLSQRHIGIFANGFPLGFRAMRHYIIYNHHHIIIKTYGKPGSPKSIVGFMVQPLSLSNERARFCESPSFQEFITFSSSYKEEHLKVDNDESLVERMSENFFIPQELEKNITFTYSVAFEESNIKWSSRWDIYLYKGGGEVHWISILNTFVMTLVLTCIVGGVFKRAVGRDISAYNESSELDLEGESGWKQLKGDVFRNPTNSSLFCIVVGTGAQILSMSFCTMIFACIGFLVPENRGELITIILVLFAMTGIIAGSVSGRLYRMFSGEHWKKNALGTALLVPGIAFTVFFTINQMILSEDKTRAVSFYSLLQLLATWLCISLPLTFIGSAIGYKSTLLTQAVSVSRIPKPLPLKHSYKVNTILTLCGCLPFASMLIEVNYIMASVWHHTTFYYLFGFLLLSLVFVVVVSAEVAVLSVYIYLCKEDYRWWWVSVGVPGSSGAYFMIYAVYYYFFELTLVGKSSVALYFGYMAVASMVFSLITATSGFIASFVFVRKIYSLVKHD